MNKKILAVAIAVSLLAVLLLFTSCGGNPSCVHDVVNGECDLCGQEASKGLEFEYNSANDNYSVVGIGSCKDDVVIVPDKHRGKPVVLIKGFSDADIRKIYLPETLSKVEGSCFKENTSIEEVYTRNTVEIEIRAFKGCTSLKKVNLDVQQIYSNAFEGCTALESVKLSNRIERIAQEAFLDCAAIAEFDLEKLDKGEALRIDQDAFKNSGIYESESLWTDGALYIGTVLVSVDKSLEVLTLREDTTSFALDAFAGCSKLHTILVALSDENKSDWDFSNRVSYADCSLLKRIEFLDGVTSVPENMFANCVTVSEIILPETLKTIQNAAFKGCTGLTEIKLPESLITILGNAFDSTGITYLVLPENVELVSYLPNIRLFSNASVSPNNNYYNEKIYLAGEWSYVDGVPTLNP